MHLLTFVQMLLEKQDRAIGAIMADYLEERFLPQCAPYSKELRGDSLRLITLIEIVAQFGAKKERYIVRKVVREALKGRIHRKLHKQYLSGVRALGEPIGVAEKVIKGIVSCLSSTGW